MKNLCCFSSTIEDSNVKSVVSEAVEIVKIRFAKVEISQEYESMKQVIA